MSAKSILIGFLPWIAFSLIATRVGPGAVGMAALLALVVAVVLTVRTVRRGESPKLLELAGIGVFAVFGAIALVEPASDAVFAFYGRGLAALALAVLVFVTLPFRPFTEQYARESTPRQYWDTPTFHAINRRISAAWGGTIAVMAVGHLIAGALAANAAESAGYLTQRPGDLILNWVIPGLLVLATVRYSQRVAGGAPAPQHSPRHEANYR
ncbi:hypothetical protein [Actinomycetospora soli]|uniref:hypothetical protein n=1 Tax=Actinomycetospora soli TaxID=2893887 RepID=UPI001E3811E2|nr:hypothetical protein [Actinomycetospora soli]MCD2189386.1 hypothetical protein [Actinomycetospora soli]